MTGPPERNELQFRLRTLVIGIVVLTVTLGLYAAYGQRLSPHARWLGYAWSMIIFVVGVPYYFYLSWGRARANRRSGGRLMPAATIVIDFPDINVLPIFMLVICGIAGVFVVLYATQFQEAHDPAATSRKWLTEVGIMYGVLFLAFKAVWHSQSSNELYRQYLCENGLLLGVTRVIPWAGFRKWDWKPGFPNTARLWGTSGRFYLFPVEPTLRDETADVLNHYIARGPREGGTRPGHKQGGFLPRVPKPRT